ncbi:MAG TPA: hypothetical protein VNB67_07305, partial [Nitrososphaeraceae archaeon]|nr:hypothetical protein [Nitrososphaeraceae archaeon]
DKWFSEFLGVGYRYHDIYMNVLLLFSSHISAARLWNKTVDGWADDQIRLQFVEEKDQYWIILFHEGSSLLLKDSMGFIKQVPKSKNYERFKTRFEDKIILRFAMYANKSKNKEVENVGYELNLLKKSKYVYRVEFLRHEEIPLNSIVLKIINEVKETSIA